MASSGKRKTTMAKLTRESRLRERRLEKKARKDRRKQAAIDGPGLDELGNPLAPIDELGDLPLVDEFGNPFPDEESEDSDSETASDAQTSSSPSLSQ
jgi:hypothetical protein